MTAIEDVITSITALLGQTGEAQTSAGEAVASAEEGVKAAAGVGIESSVEAMSALKEQLEGIATQLAAVAGTIEETQQAAEQIAAGT